MWCSSCNATSCIITDEASQCGGEELLTRKKRNGGRVVKSSRCVGQHMEAFAVVCFWRLLWLLAVWDDDCCVRCAPFLPEGLPSVLPVVAAKE